MKYDSKLPGQFPAVRMRRNRKNDWARRMVRENSLTVNDMILPVFVKNGSGICEPIASMPGVNRYSIDTLLDFVGQAAALKIPAVAIFPVTAAEAKSEDGDEALNPDNLICSAMKAIRTAGIDIGLIADVALDPYTTHGQDGVLRNGDVANDESLEILAQQAVVQAEAGCDIIAPSDMMDGRVGVIRKALDENGHQQVQIMAY